jgi:hypothetical protein
MRFAASGARVFNKEGRLRPILQTVFITGDRSDMISGVRNRIFTESSGRTTIFANNPVSSVAVLHEDNIHQ